MTARRTVRACCADAARRDASDRRLTAELHAEWARPDETQSRGFSEPHRLGRSRRRSGGGRRAAGTC